MPIVTRHRNSQPGTSDECGLVTPDFTAALDGLTEAELAAELEKVSAYMIELEEYIGPMRSQLSKAKAQARASHLYADPSWFERIQRQVERADSLMKRCHLRIQSIGFRRHAIRIERTKGNIKAANDSGNEFLKAFFRAARDILPPAKYLEILKQAKGPKWNESSPHKAGPDVRPIKQRVADDI